jgi:hypothetical protein
MCGIIFSLMSFLMGGSRWGGGDTIIHAMTHSDILSVLAAIHGLLSIMTYTVVFMLHL